MLVTTLEKTFVSHRAPSREVEPDQQTDDFWRARYDAALLCFRRAGIEITQDPRAGAEAYIACRLQWNQHIVDLAPSMAYTLEEIDPAMNSLQAHSTRKSHPLPLHLAE